MLPFEFRNFKGRSTVEKLAEIWNANIATMIRNGRHLQIVRFEDLLTDPEYAATSIMQRLQMPIAVPEINKLIRYVSYSMKLKFSIAARYLFHFTKSLQAGRLAQ